MFADVLVQFALRLAFGLCFALFAVSSQQVTSGFFRIQLWIVMGLDTLAGLVLLANHESRTATMIFAGAFLAYGGATGWLYERRAWGNALTVLAMALNVAPFLQLGATENSGWIDSATSGCLLGFTVTAMLLGHWYLNVPGMKLQPLRCLLLGMGIAIAARVGVGMFEVYSGGLGDASDTGWWSALAMRWLAGLVASSVLAVMTWQTLRIPNTQSATGILYVAVILVFLGELSSQMMAKERIREDYIRLPAMSGGTANDSGFNQ